MSQTQVKPAYRTYAEQLGENHTRTNVTLIFTAPTPPGVGCQNCDAESAGMIALLKYRTGLHPLDPFQRCDQPQAWASTSITTLTYPKYGPIFGGRRLLPDYNPKAGYLPIWQE